MDRGHQVRGGGRAIKLERCRAEQYSAVARYWQSPKASRPLTTPELEFWRAPKPVTKNRKRATVAYWKTAIFLAASLTSSRRAGF
jgi:hypothetical protein